MLSLYQMLFSKRYWRNLSLGAVWREAGLSLRRAHKDPRARKFLLQLLVLLLVPFLCILYFAWLVSSGAILFVPFVIPAIWWIRRGHKRNQPLQIVPQSGSRSMPVEEDNPAIREYLTQMGVLYAAMLDRAGSESFLREKELPPNVEVISRRTHIDLMRRTGVWDKMANADREAMMIPDGHWGPELIARTSLGVESLRLLRWILRVDYFLPVIGRDSSPSYAIAHEIVADPQKVLDAKKLIDRNSLTAARRAAEHYFYRCAAESISRGYHEAGFRGHSCRTLSGPHEGADPNGLPYLDRGLAHRFRSSPVAVQLSSRATDCLRPVNHEIVSSGASVILDVLLRHG
jgi:hypothetical protein